MYDRDHLIAEFGDNVKVYRTGPYGRRPQVEELYESHQNLIPDRDIKGNPRRYWVHTPHEYFLFDADWGRTLRRHRAQAWGAIIAETGCTDLNPDWGYVPIGVAKRGKAYIAAYLHITHRMTISELAERLDVTRETTRQYIRDVSEQRR